MILTALDPLYTVERNRVSLTPLPRNSLENPPVGVRAKRAPKFVKAMS